jgi:hypothetical protein
MGCYPVEIRRCQHIKTNGTQCGSPALREKKFCHFHQDNRPEGTGLYIDGEHYTDATLMMPVFEDAHAIQVVLRQTLQLLFERRISQKDAGLALYALQIASSNLRQMREEKPRPTEVVIDREKVEETPIGMTQWSATGEGRDVEVDEGAQEALGTGGQKALTGAQEDLEPLQGEMGWADMAEKAVSFFGSDQVEGLPALKCFLHEVATRLEYERTKGQKSPKTGRFAERLRGHEESAELGQPLLNAGSMSVLP